MVEHRIRKLPTPSSSYLQILRSCAKDLEGYDVDHKIQAVIRRSATFSSRGDIRSSHGISPVKRGNSLNRQTSGETNNLCYVNALTINQLSALSDMSECGEDSDLDTGNIFTSSETKGGKSMQQYQKYNTSVSEQSGTDQDEAIKAIKSSENRTTILSKFYSDHDCSHMAKAESTHNSTRVLDWKSRLQCTFKLWYLPEVSRENATMFLLLSDEGNFIIRPSSRSDGMALSMRSQNQCLHFSLNVLPDGLQLSQSQNLFSTFTDLVEYYSLPNSDMVYQLTLPRFLMRIHDPVKLRNIASLGEEFWRKFGSIQRNFEKLFSVSSPTADYANITRNLDDAPVVQNTQYFLPDLSNERQNIYENDAAVALQLSCQKQHVSSTSSDFQSCESTAQHYIKARSNFQGPNSTEVHVTSPTRPSLLYGNLRNKGELQNLAPLTVHNRSFDSVTDANVLNRHSTYKTYDRKFSFTSSDDTLYCQPWDEKNSELANLMLMIRQAEERWQRQTVRQNIQEQILLDGQHFNSSSCDNMTGMQYNFLPPDNREERVMPEPEASQLTKSPFLAASKQLALLDDRRSVGYEVRTLIFKMAKEENSLLSKNIKSFISCTKDSKSDPMKLMKNVRQFISGLRNYIFASERELLEEAIAKEQTKLVKGELLNVEFVIEVVMIKLVIQPLKQHIYQAIYDVHEYTDSLKSYIRSVDISLKKSRDELGVPENATLPDEKELEIIRGELQKMVESFSPIKKMDHLLKAVGIILQELRHSKQPSTEQPQRRDRDSISAEDFLSIFVYCISRCRFYNAELEAEYVEGLLPPALLHGETGYYLNTLQAAVQVLKILNEIENQTDAGISHSTSMDQRGRGVVRVIIADDVNSCVQSKAFPLRTYSTVKDLCNLIIHRLSIFNPLDFSLYHYVDGQEYALNDCEYPMKIKQDCESIPNQKCIFIYKRTDSYFVIPNDAF